jgi:hypothetical protein
VLTSHGNIGIKLYRIAWTMPPLFVATMLNRDDKEY